jgi:hypothetical protein
MIELVIATCMTIAVFALLDYIIENPDQINIPFSGIA